MSNEIINPVVFERYDELEVSFTSDGWFNATKVSERFGKRPNDWLSLQSTERYISALERASGTTGKSGSFVRTIEGRNGGSWFHPKLGTPLARWCDADFAVWCDDQVTMIINGTHPQMRRNVAALPNFDDPIEAAEAFIEAKKAERRALTDASIEKSQRVAAENRADRISGVLDEILPKANAHDAMIAMPGSKCVSDAAKANGVERDWLFWFLESIQWVFKRTRGDGRDADEYDWLPNDDARKEGYVTYNKHVHMRDIPGTTKSDPVTTFGVRLTLAGVGELAERLAKLRAAGPLPGVDECKLKRRQRLNALRDQRNARKAADADE